MAKTFQRILSFLMAVMLCVSMLPTSAFAAEADTGEDTEPTQEVTETTEVPAEEATEAPAEESEETVAPEETEKSAEEEISEETTEETGDPAEETSAPTGETLTGDSAEDVELETGDGVVIDSTNFSDEIFRAYIRDKFDANEDGFLDQGELDAVTNIQVSNREISSLAGVEFFTNLVYLGCWNNCLTELNVSKNLALEELDCDGNDLRALDLSNNKALISLSCSNTLLTSLDLSGNDNLTSLSIMNLHCPVILTDGTFDVGHLPGFNPEKASNWTGAVLDGTVLTVDPTVSRVTYDYDCGSGYDVTFQLTPFRKTTPIGVLELGEDIWVDMDASEQVTYSLVVPQNGEYVVNNDSWCDIRFALVGPDGTILEDGMDRITATLEAGVKYDVIIWNQENEEVGPRICAFDPATPAENLEFYSDQLTLYVNQTEEMGGRMKPWFAKDTYLEWTSSDENVAVITRCYNDDGWLRTWIKAVNPGTATISITDRSGISANLTVTVPETTETFALGETKELSLAGGKSTSYFVTVSESGRYIFTNSRVDDASIFLYDAEGTKIWYEDVSVNYDWVDPFDLEAGQQYLMVVENGYDGYETYCLCFERAKTEPENIDISCDDYYSNQKELTLLLTESGEVSYSIAPSYLEGQTVCWASSDENVVCILDSWDSSYSASGSAELLAAGVGTAIITATTENGLSDSIRVTVVEPTPIACGNPVFLSYEEGGYLQYLVFAPEEDGDYLLRKNGAEQMTWQIYQEDTQEYMEERFHAQAGKRYIVKIYLYEISACGEMILEKMVAPEAVYLLRNRISGYVGQSITLDYEWAPVNSSAEEITWSVDSDILEISAGSYGSCEVRLLKEGNCTITATLPNGEFESVQVTAVRALTIVCGETKALNLDIGESAYFYFTPEENGIYHFRGTSGLSFNLKNEYNYVVGSNEGLNAGETYILTVTNSLDSGTQEVSVEGPPEATSLTMWSDYYSGYVGGEINLWVNENPPEKITWVSSDPSVVRISGTSSSGCHVELIMPGMVTITASTASGLSGSCTVVAKEKTAREISRGFSEKFAAFHYMDDTTELAFSFTPEETGEYIIWADGGISARISVMDEDGGILAEDQNRVYFMAETGKTCTIDVSVELYEANAFTLSLDECVEPTGLELTMYDLEGERTGPNSFRVCVGDTFSFEEIFTPVNARHYTRHELIWSTDREDILDIFLDKTGDVEPIKAGTASLTARIGEASYTCTIEVVDGETITAGSRKTLTLNPGERAYYKFIPAESGTYVLWDENQTRPYLSLRAEMLWNSGRSRLQFSGSTGTPVRLIVENITNCAQSMEICLEKSVPLMGIALHQSEYTGNVGESIPLDVQYIPANGYVPYDIYERADQTWSIENENIAQVMRWYDSSYIEPITLKFVGEGSTRVAVKVDDFIASAPVTVSDPGKVDPPEVDPPSTEENPIDVYELPLITGEIAPGETKYFRIHGATEMVLICEDSDAEITVDGLPYDGTPLRGSPREPNLIAVTNRGEEAKSFTLCFDYPVGHPMNPAELSLGENTAVVAADNRNGYIYNYTASEYGTLTIKMNGEGWQYMMNNLTYGTYGDLYDFTQEPSGSAGVIAVRPGDVVEIMVNTFDPDDIWKTPAGEVELTASFQEAARLTAKLEAVTRVYGQSSSKGLQVGDSAKINVFGTNKQVPLIGMSYEIISGEEYAVLTTDGIITSKIAGKTVKIKCSWTHDDVTKSKTISVKTIAAKPGELNLTYGVDADLDEYGYILSDGMDGDTLLVKSGETAKLFNLTLTALDQAGEPLEDFGSITWTTSSSKIATVKNGAVTIKKGASGTVTITAKSKLDTKVLAKLTIDVVDYTPGVEKSTLTINTYLEGSYPLGIEAQEADPVTAVMFVDKNGEEIDKFSIEEIDGVWSIADPGEVLKNASTKGKLVITTAHGQEEELTFTVKIANKAPTVTVKTTKKLNTKDPKGYAEITVTSKQGAIADIELESVTFDWTGENGIYTLTPNNGDAKLDKSGKITVWVEGCRYAVTKTLSVSTESVSNKAVLGEKTLTLDLSEGNEATTTLTSYFVDVAIEDATITTNNAQGKKLIVTFADGVITAAFGDEQPKAGSYKFTIKATADDGAALKAITLTVKVVK